MEDHGSRDTVATMGSVTVEPGSPNVVPGACRFTIECRDTQQTTINAIAQEVMRLLHAHYTWHADMSTIRTHPITHTLNQSLIHLFRSASLSPPSPETSAWVARNACFRTWLLPPPTTAWCIA